jgi:pimeloyl-ACP methyl ester carboxylesterase
MVIAMAGGREHAELTIRVADDRSLEVMVTGAPDGLPVVFQHGTPGGVAVYPPMVAAAAERGLRLVLYGRPGYGDSTPAPGRTVADAAADVAAILDSLGASEFVTAGWSGGGPHSLACATLLPGRCLAAATLAGVAPYPADGLDWLAGMAEDNIGEFGAALAGEQDLTKLLEAVVPLLHDITGEQLAEGIGELASASDKAVLHGELADYIAAMFRAGLKNGIDGWRDDDLAFVSDWGFPVASASGTAPVSVWQGDQDHMVPFGHGEWLAAHLPAARTHLVTGAGHMNLPFGAVFDDLLELASQR